MSQSDESQLLSITEVANLLQVPQHVLRVWEGQYSAITPVRGRNGRRYYSPEVVDLIRQVQDYSVNQGLGSSIIRQKLDGAGSDTPPADNTISFPDRDSASMPAAASASDTSPTVDTAQLAQVLRLLEKASQALAQ